MNDKVAILQKKILIQLEIDILLKQQHKKGVSLINVIIQFRYPVLTYQTKQQNNANLIGILHTANTSRNHFTSSIFLIGKSREITLIIPDTNGISSHSCTHTNIYSLYLFGIGAREHQPCWYS